MNAATHFPKLTVAPAPKPRHEPALIGVGTAALLWVLLHAAFAVSWLTAGRL
jgi:hypothetical protein